MAVTVAAFEGIETVGTTEWSMTTDTAGPDSEGADGVYQAFVDLNALAAGDVFEWRLYETVATTSGTQRRVTTAQFTGAQVEPIWASPAFVLGVGWDMTLVKISGTDRSIVWRIAKVA